MSQIHKVKEQCVFGNVARKKKAKQTVLEGRKVATIQGFVTNDDTPIMLKGKIGVSQA
jgi:hypothetical protein